MKLVILGFLSLVTLANAAERDLLEKVLFYRKEVRTAEFDTSQIKCEVENRTANGIADYREMYTYKLVETENNDGFLNLGPNVFLTRTREVNSIEDPTACLSLQELRNGTPRKTYRTDILLVKAYLTSVNNQEGCRIAAHHAIDVRFDFPILLRIPVLNLQNDNRNQVSKVAKFFAGRNCEEFTEKDAIGLAEQLQK